MPFQSCDGLRYYTFPSFGRDVAHAVFTRQGGVSPPPWASLNLGGTVGDDPERVRRNRALAFSALDRDPLSLFDVWQVHGIEAVIARAPHPAGAPHLQADIILTDQPDVTLLMRFADCVPILLYDPARRVVGLAHAGWVGTVRNTAGASIRAMQTNFNSRPEAILAAIGPSIGPDHYEVGSEVVLQVQQAFGEASASLITSSGRRTHFDLWRANQVQLQRAGVRCIEVAEVCTACHPQDWYSHRLEKGCTGRFGAMIALA